MLVAEARSFVRKVSRALRPEYDPRAPPLPPSHPFWGHARIMQVDPLDHFTRWGVEFGDAVSLRLPASRFALVLHPDGVRHVLQTNAKAYSKQTRGYNKMRLFLGNGLVTSEGDFWRRQRRIAASGVIPIPTGDPLVSPRNGKRELLGDRHSNGFPASSTRPHGAPGLPQS